MIFINHNEVIRYYQDMLTNNIFYYHRDKTFKMIKYNIKYLRFNLEVLDNYK
mgnify:CR=1 FL=1